MHDSWKRPGYFLIFILLINLVIVFSAFADSSAAATEAKAKAALDKIVAYLHDTFSKNDFKGVLDWPAVGLYAVGEDLIGNRWTTHDGKNGLYWREQEVKKGVVPGGRTTDYERLILGIIAGGGNPDNFAGKDFISALKNAQLPSGKFADSINGEGDSLINAHIWGIIALYAAGEDIPDKQKAYNWLVKHQNADGGFSFHTGINESDIDMTAMALIAFAALGKGKNDPAVAKALNFLKASQKDDGNFFSWGTPNSESCAMVIQGLVALGIDPAGSEWTRKGNNPVTALLEFQLSDGSFSHTPGGKSNGMATQHALIALADFCNGKSVYTIMREKSRQELFMDVDSNHWAYSAIRNLAVKKVINGYSDGSFRPEKEVRRAEFAKFIVFGLGYDKLAGRKTYKFDDLPAGHWANEIVKVAVDKKLITGMSSKIFAPDNYITGEQVMAILVRALGCEKEAGQVAGPWYQGYVQIAEEKGLLYPGFKVGKAATRAQCAYSVDKLQRLIEVN